MVSFDVTSGSKITPEIVSNMTSTSGQALNVTSSVSQVPMDTNGTVSTASALLIHSTKEIASLEFHPNSPILNQTTESDMTSLIMNSSVTQTTATQMTTQIITTTFIHTKSTTDFNMTNNSREVTPDWISEVSEAESEFGVAEQVVVGAVCLVGALAIMAVFLRLIMPYFHKDSKTSTNIKASLSSSTLLHVKVPMETKLSALTGYSNIAADISSQSSGSGSSPGVDWSESDSNQTRITTVGSEDKQLAMAGSYGNLRGSSLSLPMYLPADRSLRDETRGGNYVHRSKRLNDDLMSVISTQSLEPVKMEETYRNRWDDEWDPYGSLPRSTLSHYSHPSESSLCEARFPKPTKEQLQKMQKDKERRYPSSKGGLGEARKEKSVRVTTPKKR